MNPNTISLPWQARPTKLFSLSFFMKKEFWFWFSLRLLSIFKKSLELKTQGSLKFYGIEARD